MAAKLKRSFRRLSLSNLTKKFLTFDSKSNDTIISSLRITTSRSSFSFLYHSTSNSSCLSAPSINPHHFRWPFRTYKCFSTCDHDSLSGLSARIQYPASPTSCDTTSRILHVQNIVCHAITSFLRPRTRPNLRFRGGGFHHGRPYSSCPRGPQSVQ